ncbi:MAG: putative 2OG-Fe(II) oxygenase, partial [Alphaproteobacteria bacterium]
YEAAIAAAPGHVPAYNNLGTALEKLGRLDRAAEAFRRALERMPDHSGARLNLGTVLLRMGDAKGAERQFEAVLEREPFNRRAVAYLAVARQESGALSPAAARAALEPLIHEEYPGCPEAFPTLKEFHARLAEELYAHPARRRDVSGTATTGGYDALRLFDHGAPALNAFEDLLRAAIDRHITRLPREAGHPFPGRRPDRYALDIWATFLESGGYQFPHLHPSGWISGVYYVQVPSSVSGGSGGHEGWIEFNRPDESFGYTFRPETILKRPQPGLLLLFPSYAYHRTLPFESDTDRISIAFDVKPAG